MIGIIGEYTSTYNVYHRWITNYTYKYTDVGVLNFDLTTIILFTNLYIYYYDFNGGECMVFIYIGQ